MARLVFVDSGVLIAAARGTDQVSERALEMLEDPELSFASSPFVRLEVLPKPVYNRRPDEAEFYEEFFRAVTAWAEPNTELVQAAYDEAVRAGLSALDALHVAAAAAVGADELLTREGRTKPIHRSTLVPVRTIAPG